ncbi:MAG TPA: EamA family transporter [Phycisphaerae bacterium]|nr:EamA family transporter [Phycisphaerae bacterium]
MPAWLMYAFLSALAAAFVGIFGKLGMKDIDSNAATIIRSIFMTLFLIAFGMATRLWPRMQGLPGKAMVAIALSGVAGAVSWLFYFKALQVGSLSKVAPIDKLSMPLAIVLAVLILGDRPTLVNWMGIGLIAAGAYLATWRGAGR